MRFSPVLLAALATSAAFGSAHPAQAEEAHLLSQELEVSNYSNLDNPAATAVSFPEEVASEEGMTAVGGSENGIAEFSEAGIGGAEPTIMELLAQEPAEPTPDLPEEPEEPPAGSQTPEQETPNELELIEPTDPEVEVESETEPGIDPEVIEEEVDEAVDEAVEETEEESPAAPPPTIAPGTSPTPSTESPAQEPRVLVAEVVVAGADDLELQDIVYQAIRTQPGRTTTRSQLQEDINAVFATGFFSNVRAVPEDTPLGVRVTFEVIPNPVLESVQLQDTSLETVTYNEEEVPIQEAVDAIFSPQYGEILNLRDLQIGIEELNQLYQSNGYVLAQVVGAPQISPDGVVTLDVAEGVVEDINIRFLNREGEAVDEEGEPIRGKTRDFIITREFETQPGDVFNQQQIQSDLQRAFGLGIFEDLNISLNPGDDPRKVDVIVNVTERNTGSFAAGLGLSSASGIFGTVSLQEQNLGGNNQRLNAEVQVGQRDLLFDLSFTDPWIGGDPNRTFYTVNAFGRQSLSLVFQGPDDEDLELENGDRPRVRRFGGGVLFGRPLDNGWQVSVGTEYQRVSIRDADGDLDFISDEDTLLSFSDSGTDDLWTFELAASQDRRNDPLRPTSGSFLRLSTEQSVPVGNGSILLNRLRGSYSYFIPVRLTDFTPGCRLEDPTPNDCPQTLAFNIQAGTVLGDLPPYEAFSMGGTDSVRGYGPGELSSSRTFLQGTVEYRFPVFSIVGGALFLDAGTDFGTQGSVPGEPGELLDKPGSGFGFGVGVRVQSPLGQIRVDYAINDEGDDRIHFGIGERF